MMAQTYAYHYTSCFPGLSTPAPETKGAVTKIASLRGNVFPPSCHCEAVLRLPWQSPGYLDRPKVMHPVALRASPLPARGETCNPSVNLAFDSSLYTREPTRCHLAKVIPRPRFPRQRARWLGMTKEVSLRVVLRCRFAATVGVQAHSAGIEAGEKIF